MRDDKWLWALLDETWDKYFSDVPQDNTVRIRFGRKAKTRLGSIRLDCRDSTVSVITMNGLFRDRIIPIVVIQATLVHELCHYAHGFNSPLEQRFRHPHAGGVMRAEFRERGLEAMYVEQRRWIRAHWSSVIERSFPQASQRGRPAKGLIKTPTRIPRPFWF